MTRKPLLVVFLTVFIDLVGFGIVLPLLPIYSDQFGAKGWMIGAIMASIRPCNSFSRRAGGACRIASVAAP